MLSRTAFGAALALLVAFAPRVHAEADDEAGAAPPAEARAAAGGTADDAPGDKPARHHRRHKSNHRGRFVGHVVPEDRLRTDPLPRPSGNLTMVSLNNPDEDPVKVNIYNADGSYNVDALERLNHILRCRRTDTETDMGIAGVSPKKIEAFAETLDRGGMGIGIYPRSQFVHIDVRSPPSYRWTDWSPPGSNANEKRPPRGWKRKKLNS